MLCAQTCNQYAFKTRCTSSINDTIIYYPWRFLVWPFHSSAPPSQFRDWVSSKTCQIKDRAVKQEDHKGKTKYTQHWNWQHSCRRTLLASSFWSARCQKFTLTPRKRLESAEFGTYPTVTMVIHPGNSENGYRQANERFVRHEQDLVCYLATTRCHDGRRPCRLTWSDSVSYLYAMTDYVNLLYVRSAPRPQSLMVVSLCAV